MSWQPSLPHSRRLGRAQHDVSRGQEARAAGTRKRDKTRQRTDDSHAHTRDRARRTPCLCLCRGLASTRARRDRDKERERANVRKDKGERWATCSEHQGGAAVEAVPAEPQDHRAQRHPDPPQKQRARRQGRTTTARAPSGTHTPDPCIRSPGVRDAEGKVRGEPDLLVELGGYERARARACI